MNVFNLISAGGGKSEGIYIWKKSAYTPELSITNPSITITTYAGTVAWCYVKGDNFNATLLPEIPQLSGNIDKYSTDEKVKAVALFFEGFVSGNYSFGNDSAGLYLKSGATYYRFNAGQINGESYVLRCVSSITILSGTTFTYNGTKSIPAKIGDFIDYVISDKEDAYPDAAEQGGFYYERFEPLNVDVFNCSKVVTGEFTPTSANTQYTVTHGFGEYAKLSFLYDEASGDFLLTHYSRGGNYVPAPVYVLKYNGTYSQGYQNSSYGNNQNAIFYWGGNNFKVGTKYKYLIMA